MSARQDHKRDGLRFRMQSAYLTFLLPILLAATVWMGANTYRDLYSGIDDGFGRQLSAVSTVVGAFIDGDRGMKTILRKPAVECLAYVDSRSALFGIDRESGQLVTIDPRHGGLEATQGHGLEGITALAHDPGADVLYGLDRSGSHLAVIAMDRGEATATTPLPQPCTGLAYHLEEKTLYAGGAALLRVEPISGDAKVVGPLSVSLTGLVYDPSAGRLLGIDETAQKLVAIDPQTAAVRPLGRLRSGPQPTAVARSAPVQIDRQDFLRALEYDRVRGMASPGETAAARSLVLDIAQHIHDVQHPADTEVETPDAEENGPVEVVESESAPLLLFESAIRGLAWDAERQYLLAAADGLVGIDPNSGTVWEEGWWRGFHNEVSDAYLDEVLPMRRIKEKLNVTYLYAFYHPEKQGPDDIIYLLDASTDEDHSAIGDEDTYPEGTGYQVYGKVTLGGVYQSDVEEWAEWGLLKTGYAPIYDTAGLVCAIVGTDIDVSIIEPKARIALLKTLAVGLFAFFATLLAVYLVILALTKPIAQLREKTISVAAGHYGEQAPIEGPAEVKELCSAFNRLSQALKKSSDERSSARRRLTDESARRELTRMLSREYAALAKLREGAVGSLHIGVEETVGNFSGAVEWESRVIAWAGKQSGDALQEAKLRCEIAYASVCLLEKHGGDWNAISSLLERIYPDRVEWFVYMDSENGETRVLPNCPLACVSIDAQGHRRELPLSEITSTSIQESQALILSSPEAAPLVASFLEGSTAGQMAASGAHVLADQIRVRVRTAGVCVPASTVTIVARPRS